MKKSNSRHDALKDLLREAYFGKEALPAGDQWEQNVMRAIGRLPRHQIRSNDLAAFEELVWKFAPAAAVLILFFTFALFNMDLIPDSEIVRYLFNGCNQYGITQFLTL